MSHSMACDLHVFSQHFSNALHFVGSLATHAAVAAMASGLNEADFDIPVVAMANKKKATTIAVLFILFFQYR